MRNIKIHKVYRTLTLQLPCTQWDIVLILYLQAHLRFTYRQLSYKKIIEKNHWIASLARHRGNKNQHLWPLIYDIYMNVNTLAKLASQYSKTPLFVSKSLLFRIEIFQDPWVIPFPSQFQLLDGGSMNGLWQWNQWEALKLLFHRQGMYDNGISGKL